MNGAAAASNILTAMKTLRTHRPLLSSPQDAGRQGCAWAFGSSQLTDKSPNCFGLLAQQALRLSYPEADP